MDLRKLKKLIDLVEESGISELEITEGEEKVKIVKSGSAPTAVATTAPPPAPTARPVAPTALPPEAGDRAQEGHALKSPMVGTFYRTPSPDAKPFVEVGQSVKEGQIICIIEAMKLMNEIECECDGEITAAYVDNGQPVQFGDRIFAVKVD